MIPHHITHAGIIAAARMLAAPASGLVVAVIPFTFPTSTGGTFDITDNGQLGGLTPKGAIFLGGHATTVATEGPGGPITFGFTDGTYQWAVGITDTDNNGNTVCRTYSNNGACAISGVAASPGVPINTASFAAFITDGIRLNAVTGTTALRGVAILFAGDVDVAAGAYTTTIASTTPKTITCGFEPSFVFGACSPGTENSEQSGTEYGFGVSTAAAHASFALGEQSLQAAGGNPKAYIGDTHAVKVLSPTGTVRTDSVLFNNFTATTFDLVPSVTTTRDFMWLAVRVPNGVALLNFDTPTATGVDSITGAGFTPSAAIGMLTSLETRNGAGPVTSTADSSNHSFFAFTAAAAHSYSSRIDLTDPTDTGTIDTTNAVHLGVNSGATDIVAALDAFTSDGVDLNYSDINADPKLGWILLLQ